MKKENVTISSPDELNKHLQSSSPVTWMVLITTIMVMVAFFVWSFVFKIPIRLSGTAVVKDGQATLVVDENAKDKLVAGEKVYILDQEGVASYIDDEFVVLNLTLADGNYTYRTDIVIKEVRPIDFLIKK